MRSRLGILIAWACVASASSTISPLVVPPSLYWDGDDGRWSSFYISVGTPAQDVRVLPGTSAEACTLFYVVMPIGCTIVNPKLDNCAEHRGGLFQSNESTSWSTDTLNNDADGAIYTLPLIEENAIGIAANGSLGFDTVSLGLNSNLPVLQHSLIAQVWTDDFFLGTLPLSPWPSNITFEDPIVSPMGKLRNASQIPSLSYGYTAGAFYQDPMTSKFGSLTLGGYDTSRFTANDVVFSFGSDISRDLLLKLTTIQYDTQGSSPLLTSTVDVFIDSLVSDLWLPVSVCEQFKTAFNLTYSAPYYLVDTTVHNTLLKQNPKFSFHLSNGSSETVITLPYAAFDLNLTSPIIGSNSTGYFPIRQAQNETQYVLGRTFLQEAYIVVDYERRSFSVNQAVFPSTSVSTNVVAIDVVGGTVDGTSRLGKAAIACIAVGGVVAITIMTAIALYCRRRSRKRLPAYEPHWLNDIVEHEQMLANSKLASSDSDVHEMTNEHRHEMPHSLGRLEMADSYLREMDAAERPHELDLGGQLSLHGRGRVKAVNEKPVELASW